MIAATSREGVEKEAIMLNMGKATAGGSADIMLLGKDVRFKGVLQFEGTAQIDSHLEGEIHTTGLLTIGEHAVIKGTINAGTVVSRGKIKGTITATETVQLLKSAILIGEVRAPSFAMEAGAHIHGQIDMGASPWAEESSPEFWNESDWGTLRTSQRVPSQV